MVLLGGSPGGAVAVLGRCSPVRFAGAKDGGICSATFLAYAIFPLLGGVTFHAVVDQTPADPSQIPAFYLLIFALFRFRPGIDFLIIASPGCYAERNTPCRQSAPFAPSPAVGFASTMHAVGMTFIYYQVGSTEQSRSSASS